jgi:hypothetical protein
MVMAGLMTLLGGRAAPRPLPSGRKLLTGVVSSAADYPSWKAAFGGRLSVRMKFQAWAFDTPPAEVLDGPGIPMISWEPWNPTRLGSTLTEQGAPQPAYSNAAIADGKWDPYLTQWADAIKAYGRPVILRPMHEFNGPWYPWSRNPKQFVRAWRHIWTIFHRVGADNVTWVWSFQPGLGPWRTNVMPYWPGRRYVDVIGMSMVRFERGPSVQFYLNVLEEAHDALGLPTMISEANVAYSLRLAWLQTLRTALPELPFNEGFIWSQAPSQQEARDSAAGNMNWDARRDASAAALLGEIASGPR